MRTNIDIDDGLMRAALKATGAPTKKAAVEEALRTVVRLADQTRLRDLRGAVAWAGDLDAMRRDR